MWILRLNDMRTPKIETVNAICRAETCGPLIAFLEKESVPRYQDGKWLKSYKKGGSLEWFNPAPGEKDGVIDVGTEEEWVQDAREAFNTYILSIPTI